ncbi:MAG: PLP-dependent aminotransferase family protein [Rhodospirillaceae bacterium]|nr:PLP-dependent aminotransferase family protein [Rhodospirillaceae bacterium]MBT4487149.1 PLP-dependent aminotransferase family protein [Rhodospirillaceae bacterium]MBT5898427.1 PLP-dependent aminotransferase family protein [Rhodospirillaceae bacterium]MBT6430277.1 PLP-dependent aminotransferase family protein [Rhodospirillaceae bacterium]
MTIYQPDISSRSGPKYRAIAQAIGDDIAAGRLAPGTRLPAHRDLAWRLGVTVGTVSRAYGEAAKLDLIGGEVGRGTYVLEPARAETTSLAGPVSHLIEMTQNSPPLGPHGAALSDSLQHLAAIPNGNALLGYNTEIGPEVHRRAGAAWLRRVGLNVGADDIIMMGGAQLALLSALMTFSKANDPVLLEQLTYSQLIDEVHFTQRHPVPLAMDDEGIEPQALDTACRETGAKLLFLVPTLQNPTNAVMSLARRQAIIEVARRHDLLMVEDDVYGYLLQERPPPIAALAPERTIYITSASKCLAPGLRVAWVVAPRDRLPRLAEAARIITVTQPGVMGAVASHWIDGGRAETLLHWLRREVAARYGIAREKLAGLDWHGHEAAFHVMLKLPAPWHSDDFTAAARMAGITVQPISSFTVGVGALVEAVRVTLTQVSDHETLGQALATLRNILERGPSRPRAVI